MSVGTSCRLHFGLAAAGTLFVGAVFACTGLMSGRGCHRSSVAAARLVGARLLSCRNLVNLTPVVALVFLSLVVFVLQRSNHGQQSNAALANPRGGSFP